MKQCPCNDCICVPVCRHKKFCKLTKECELLHIYDPHINLRLSREPQKLLDVEYVLEPTSWRYQYDSVAPYASIVISIGGVGLGGEWYYE